MDAPVDIVISIIKRLKVEAEAKKSTERTYSPDWSYWTGRVEAYEDLIEELEGFKKLFS